MKSKFGNQKIAILFVMCCWQAQILGKNIYEEVRHESHTKIEVKTTAQINEHSFEKPYVLEQNTN